MNGLADYVRAALRLLETDAAPLPAKLAKLPGIRAVAFDLYGTLLISAAGGESAGDTPDPAGLPGFEETFWGLVRRHHEDRRSEGVAHPEVDVRAIWIAALRELGKPVPAPGELEFAALAHECRVNPVWPMPGAAEVLARLKHAGLVLGIVSNAQFYTLPVMEGLFGGPLDGLGFHPGLRIFSFEAGEGKPSPRLFAMLRDRAAALGIGAPEILYVGNDLHKDVLPARAAGFRTALFAGDARSLRLGGIPADEAAAVADAVITDLAQIPAIL